MDVMTEFMPTRQVSLTDRVHDQILELIIKNASEEEMVLTEKKLMELLGVSKAPVREALIKLCSEDVLINIPRFGYRVVRMTEKDARDAKRMRSLLELEALRTSFSKLGDAELKQLKEQVKKAAAKQNTDVWEVWEDNEEFHLLLASFSGNKVLMKLLRDCMGILKRTYAQQRWNSWSSMDDSVDNSVHATICRHLEERNLESTLELLRKDIEGCETEG
ncbi:MAG: GntR family transcriptional regulator [Lachnospiraceae bacterium]|nr:GntR family transcriptional regulator [Lachnospiraceae bacterium]